MIRDLSPKDAYKFSDEDEDLISSSFFGGFSVQFLSELEYFLASQHEKSSSVLQSYPGPTLSFIISNFTVFFPMFPSYAPLLLNKFLQHLSHGMLDYHSNN